MKWYCTTDKNGACELHKKTDDDDLTKAIDNPNITNVYGFFDADNRQDAQIIVDEYMTKKEN